MSEQFDAWSESEPPEKPQGRSSRTTGMMLIGGVFAMIVCMLGLLIVWSFRVVRPSQERRFAEATEVRKTQQAGFPLTSAAAYTNVAEERMAQTAAASTPTADTDIDEDDLEAFGVEPLPDWDMQMHEGFSHASWGWESGFVFKLASGREAERIFENGKLKMRLFESDFHGTFVGRIPALPTIKDGLILVDAEQLQGFSTSSYGVGFRSSNEGYYYFWLTSENEWGLSRYETSGESFSQIETGTFNQQRITHMAVFMNGTQVDLYLNGELVHSMTDDPQDGTGRIMLVLDAEGVAAEAAFDNLTIYSP